MLKKRTGTPLYMAPDLFFGWYGLKVDMWAAGMLTYQLISGKLPFFGDNVEKLANASPMAIMQAFMDSEVCALMQNLLELLDAAQKCCSV